MSIETYVKALQNPDPQKRRQAIVALGKSGDKRALKPLADTYNNDSDPQLRELALKAGRHLRKELSADEPQSEPVPAPQSSAESGGFMFINLASSPSTSTFEPADQPGKAAAKDDVPDWMQKMGGDRPAPRPISDRDRTRAASYVERAMDASVRGDKKKMIDLLEKGFEINPGLEKDSRAMGMLAMAFDTSSDKALEALRARKGSKPKGGSAEKGEWSAISDFFIEMGIWVLLIGLLLSGATYWVITQINWDELKAEAAAEGATPEEIQFYEDLEKEIEEQGPQLALYIGFGYGTGLVVYTTIISTFIWIVGTFMEGSGILFTFITSIFRAIAVILVIATVLFVLAFTAAPRSDAAFLLGFAPIGFGMLYMGYAVGKAHEFGMAMGCLNLIVSIPACNAVWCVLSFIMGL